MANRNGSQFDVKKELFVPVTHMRQGQVDYLSFAITATQLGTMGVPIRYIDDPTHGVQRNIIESRVKALMETMEKGGPIPGLILLNLIGAWEVDDSHLLGAGDAIMEILDGQQRGECSRRHVEEGKSHLTDGYQFPVQAVVNAPDELRRRLFVTQSFAAPISREHTATSRMLSESYRTENERQAYAIASILMTHPHSILRNRVHLGDRIKEGRKFVLNEGSWLSLPSLLTALLQIGSPKSVLNHMSVEEKAQLVVDLFNAADRCFPTQFGDGGSLRTPFGVACLIQLLSRDGTFRARLQQAGWNKGVMEDMFRRIPRFQWTVRPGQNNRHATPGMVVTRLNMQLAKAYAD